MTRTWIIWALAAGGCLAAQTASRPELGLDINGQSDAVVARGWPLLIRASLISSDGGQVPVGLKNGPWTQALRLSVTDSSGVAQTWPLQLQTPAAPAPTLSGINNSEAVWLVAPSDTASIAAGVYSLAVTLDTTAGAAAGSWNGVIQSNGASVQIRVEPATLSSEEEASKYLALSAYAKLRGDAQGAGAALDTLISRQPTMLEAYTEKGDLLASAGDYAGALAQYNATLSKFLATNPNPKEPLTMFTRPITAVSMQLAGQQLAASGGVSNVAPGGTASVFAPDSIVTAYGSSLATATASASGSLSTSLSGTTVTITDSSGSASPAQLFYVSPGQVNYAVPPNLATGTATVAVKSGDGSTHNGSATIVDVQPGLFALNGAGLVAGGILRVTADGRQLTQDLYTVDASGAVIAAPVDVSKDQVYLILYATGIRRAALAQVTISIGGVSLPAAYAGAQGFFVGLDQINVQLPASLAGRGDLPLVLTAAGKASNSGRITIQ